jgi:hypothetical protein
MHQASRHQPVRDVHTLDAANEDFQDSQRFSRVVVTVLTTSSSNQDLGYVYKITSRSTTNKSVVGIPEDFFTPPFKLYAYVAMSPILQPAVRFSLASARGCRIQDGLRIGAR